MKYAVNLCDLSKCFPQTGLAGILLHDFCDIASPLIEGSKGQIDTGAMVLDGPAADDQKRLAALIDVLQTIIGPRKMGRRVRVYKQGIRGGWSEVRPPK